MDLSSLKSTIELDLILESPNEEFNGQRRVLRAIPRELGQNDQYRFRDFMKN